MAWRPIHTLTPDHPHFPTMPQPCRKQPLNFGLKRQMHHPATALKRRTRQFLESILTCYSKKPQTCRTVCDDAATASISPRAVADGGSEAETRTPLCHNHSQDKDLVPLKISLLGDSQIGKTSFLEKYVGNEMEEGKSEQRGLNLMDKTLMVRGARISYSIWEVGGDKKSQDHIPTACKDSVAILFMFDLTSRRTLKSVLRWYRQAWKWNQAAIPVLIGTKFDDFIQLPIDLQWAIASEARAYAKALNATLFFSSATYNINVNKIFKFITAKLFDLPWTLERNLTVGEPMIDF
ncbi:septum-promoting GTP-binding protein 1-like [Cucurbita moschata]|uniref:Septum-promoting GTP-binding protein 1-like n=1 Tax=Cucurbita moschata TaxID=3662 RepID=A0A6J1G5T0_CUCMO|nr:septum-promoting GTP-binding protein 1-like [Cucurbita moschata]